MQNTTAGNTEVERKIDGTYRGFTQPPKNNQALKFHLTKVREMESLKKKKCGKAQRSFTWHSTSKTT